MDRLTAGGPWFRRHPQLAAVVIILLFAGVTALRLATGDERDATGLLYALPVALAAMAFGRHIGSAAAVLATGLIWGWVITSPDSTLSALGWASRIVPLLLLGALVGAAADAVEDAANTRTALAVAETRRRHAAEVNDEILQRLTVAKWQLEAGASEAAGTHLHDAMVEAQRLVSSLLQDEDLDDRLRVRPLSSLTPVQRSESSEKTR